MTRTEEMVKQLREYGFETRVVEKRIHIGVKTKGKYQKIMSVDMVGHMVTLIPCKISRAQFTQLAHVVQVFRAVD